ncbi:MAG TPA: hypothetical protein VJ840_01280 [Gemmatimonadaceae bacterium]|nr:hypothetical protein [Gemmatimonadaceae bacterium]
MKRNSRIFSIVTASALLAACGNDRTPVEPPPAGSVPLAELGNGQVLDRYTGEVWVLNDVAYTTTWGNRNGDAAGNAVKIWDVSGDVPALIDSLIVPNAVTLGDVQSSDDGQLLVVATEFSPGSIMLYSLANPRKPQLIGRYYSALTDPGVHTAEVARVNGRLYAFLCVDIGNSGSARLVIVDITDPANPTQVFTQAMGAPYVHDTFVRDGILFIAVWDEGIRIWDIGGGGRGGTPANPIELSRFATIGGEAHNIWWYRNPITGQRRYAFVGQEGPGAVGAFASGDIHVLDVSNLSSPREVAFFHVEGAGTHNFWVDENRGLLYVAYYNAGVRVIDVNGDLSACIPADRDFTGRCDLGEMGRELGHALGDGPPVYVWGVHVAGGRLYASDMLNGIWKLGVVPFPPD